MNRCELKALEAQLTAEQNQGDEFIVYAEGLLYASVCSSLPADEVVRRMKGVTSGTHAGWLFANKPFFSTGEPNPCPCNEKPATHKHYLFNC